MEVDGEGDGAGAAARAVDGYGVVQDVVLKGKTLWRGLRETWLHGRG